MVELPKHLTRTTDVIGFILSAIGLYGLVYQPTQLSLLSSMGLTLIGASIIGGIPRTNFMWDKVSKYGIPSVIFVTGLVIFYIQMFGTTEFWELVVKWTLGGFIAGGIIYFLNNILGGPS